MYIAEPWYFTAGVTYEISTFSKAAFGAQAEVLNRWTGLWAQLGSAVDISGRPGVALSTGFSLFGIEAQERSTADHGWVPALFLKVRLPVSWLLRIGQKPRIPEMQATGG
jgi:hypothetical protein